MLKGGDHLKGHSTLLYLLKCVEYIELNIKNIEAYCQDNE